MYTRSPCIASLWPPRNNPMSGREQITATLILESRTVDNSCYIYLSQYNIFSDLSLFEKHESITRRWRHVHLPICFHRCSLLWPLNDNNLLVGMNSWLWSWQISTAFSPVWPIVFTLCGWFSFPFSYRLCLSPLNDLIANNTAVLMHLPPSNNHQIQKHNAPTA